MRLAPTGGARRGGGAAGRRSRVAGRGRRALAAALLAAAAVGLPVKARAASSTTFRVSFTYYGAAAGGVGILVYFSAAWEALSAGGGRAPATALVEVAGGRIRAGVPLPRIGGAERDGLRGDSPAVAIDLLRLRF